MRDLAIRTASADDFPLIAALARRIWPLAYAGILTPEQIENMLQRIYGADNLHEEAAQGHRFWLAYRSAEAVGYASGYREDEDIIWLKKIYVDPAAQGCGAGQLLIEAVTQAFMPARELRLLVNPHNTPAHRFYERRGFAKIGEKHVHMGDWQFDDFLYARRLS